MNKNIFISHIHCHFSHERSRSKHKTNYNDLIISFWSLFKTFNAKIKEIKNCWKYNPFFIANRAQEIQFKILFLTPNFRNSINSWVFSGGNFWWILQLCSLKILIRVKLEARPRLKPKTLPWFLILTVKLIRQNQHSCTKNMFLVFGHYRIISRKNFNDCFALNSICQIIFLFW